MPDRARTDTINEQSNFPYDQKLIPSLFSDITSPEGTYSVLNPKCSVQLRRLQLRSRKPARINAMTSK